MTVVETNFSSRIPLDIHNHSSPSWLCASFNPDPTFSALQIKCPAFYHLPTLNNSHSNIFLFMNQQEKCHLLLYIILGIISIGLFIFSIEFGVTFGRSFPDTKGKCKQSENRVYKFIVCLIYACVGVTILFHVRMWLSKDDTEFIKDGRYFILNAVGKGKSGH